MTGIAQGTKTLNGRNKILCTRIDVIFRVFALIAYTAHAGEVLNAREIVIVGEHLHGSPLSLCFQSLPAVEQQPAPTVGERVLDKAKHIIRATRMLQRGHIHQIATQHDTTVLFQPFARILKDKVILAANTFVAQGANLLR